MIRSWIKNMWARPQWNLPVTWWRHWVDHKERELVVEQHRHTLCNCSTDIINHLYYLANMWPSIGNPDFWADQSCFPYRTTLDGEVAWFRRSQMRQGWHKMSKWQGNLIFSTATALFVEEIDWLPSGFSELLKHKRTQLKDHNVTRHWTVSQSKSSSARFGEQSDLLSFLVADPQNVFPRCWRLRG